MMRTTKKHTAAHATTAAAETVDLQALLLAALAEKGITPELRWAPSGSYCSLLVGKTNIGYMFKQTRTGLRVEPAASPADLPKSVKGFEPGTRSQRFALVGLIKTPAEVKDAVAALVAAHRKQVAPAGKAAKGRAGR